jgi:hypothetical protein
MVPAQPIIRLFTTPCTAPVLATTRLSVPNHTAVTAARTDQLRAIGNLEVDSSITRAGPAVRSSVAQRRGAEDRGERGEVAGAIEPPSDVGVR